MTTAPEATVTPKAIVFDFDGTIVDTEWPVYIVARDVYRAHGLDIALEDWVATIGRADNRPLAVALEETLGRPGEPDVMDEAHARRMDWVDSTEPLPGVTEVINAAVAAGIPMAVASSSPMAWVEPHLDRLGLLHHFVAVRTRDHVDRGKPAPDLYLAAAAALDIEPATALAIEDSRHGCASAKSAGMTCVVVPNRITTLDLPTNADILLDSLSDFPFARFGLP